ncbi:16S rRNA m5C967 methyltransferase, S-adenosyl-L-methionine-dependent [Georgfuchsia toluolica]|uniref:16S rRNA (cytosine(967)-C(5))-methyltransferase n=2 Tax=Georgfuchsia toluolica TaxID=424218 RepID=A0A916J4T2_9PROT|nr:16S rRNA m5C967 methyltransferase, S-adenosyl-L-methionine-dependent [Georgfuchsia toluolica]
MPAAAPIPANPPLSKAFACAANVVAAVIGGRNLDRELVSVPQALRPAVQDLAYGALRQYGRGDALLAPLLAKPLAELTIRSLLLTSVYRLEARPDDAHTTVDQAVSAAALMANGRFKSLVNAVLRNFQRQYATLVDTALMHNSARWQHPQWWIEKVQLAYPQQWRDILTAGNGRPPMTLRLNRRRIDNANIYIERLVQHGIGARALDDSAILLDKPVPVVQLPGFATGEVSVQDWGAQRAAGLLDAQPCMRVLDACAAPGGKTAHILELADVDLTALDADAKRLQRVAENLGRLGLTAKLSAADCMAIATWWDKRPFDRILADVPCSASGVVRRHPDAKWLRRRSDVANFARTQSYILDALWQLLAPGGKMLYCTCSVFEEENRQQIQAFVSRHADARRLPTRNQQTELQLIPSAEHDGFYYTLIEKNA